MKPSNVYHADLRTQAISTNDSWTPPVADVMSTKANFLAPQMPYANKIGHGGKIGENSMNMGVQQTESMSSRPLFPSSEHCSTALMKDIKHAASAGQLHHASDSADSVNDKDEKQAKSKIETKKSRKVRKIKSVTVRPMTRAEQDRIMNDNQIRKPTAQSTIHVTRVLR